MKPAIRHAVVAGLMCSLVLTGTGLAWGQDEVPSRRESSAPATPGVRRASTVLGARVSLQGGDAVGKVTDLVINDDGCIDYVVVASEDNYVLVPWSAGTVNFAERTIVLDIPQNRWREVPTFTRDRWPDLSDARYTQRVQRYFNVSGNRRERRNERRPVQDTEREPRTPATRPGDQPTPDRGQPVNPAEPP